MPKTARVQHTYNHKSGLAEHGIVNTLYFVHPLTTWDGDQALELAQVVVDFYDDVHPGATNSIRSFIGESSMAPARHTVKVYDLADDEPRAAQIVHTTNGGSVNNLVAPMPSEVALCLSFRGALVSGEPAARRRGRIYLGPLSSGAGVQDAAGWNRPDPAVRTDVCAAAAGMAAAALVEGWTWVVHSGGGPDVGGGSFPFDTEITDVWVDDAWDTQRRRGANSTLRTTLAV